MSNLRAQWHPHLVGNMKKCENAVLFDFETDAMRTMKVALGSIWGSMSTCFAFQRRKQSRNQLHNLNILHVLLVDLNYCSWIVKCLRSGSKGERRHSKHYHVFLIAFDNAELLFLQPLLLLNLLFILNGHLPVAMTSWDSGAWDAVVPVTYAPTHHHCL